MISGVRRNNEISNINKYSSKWLWHFCTCKRCIKNLARNQTEGLQVQIFTVDGKSHPKVKTYLGDIVAYSCKHLMWDAPASKGNALLQLRLKALDIKASAIIDVTFDSRGTDAFGTNCWESVQASGVAVKF